LAESAGAAGLAALLGDPDRPQHCAVVVTGGNASADEIRALAAGPPTPEWSRRRT
jgi:threonine dehydratase